MDDSVKTWCEREGVGGSHDLDVWDTHFTQRDLVALVTSLVPREEVTALSFQHCTAAEQVDLARFLSDLDARTAVNSVDFFGLRGRSVGMEPIISWTRSTAEAKRESRIKRLSLFSMEVEEGHLARLFKYINRTNVYSLDLANCGIRNETAVELARAICENDVPDSPFKLKELVLSHNFIGEEGLINLSEVLAERPIESLHLYRCPITSKSFSMLLRHFSRSQHLRELVCIGWIESLPVCGSALLTDFIRNTKIERFKTEVMEYNPEFLEGLREALCANPRVRCLSLSRYEYVIRPHADQCVLRLDNMSLYKQIIIENPQLEQLYIQPHADAEELYKQYLGYIGTNYVKVMAYICAVRELPRFRDRYHGGLGALPVDVLRIVATHLYTLDV